MKLNPSFSMLVGCILLFTQLAVAGPAEEAVAQYRAYVAAVRAGKTEDVEKLVETIPPSSKPLLAARIKQAIAVEAVKREMLAQMGPPKAGEEGWEIGGLPYDDVLANLKPVIQDAVTIGLLATYPKTNSDVMVGWMVHRSGKWLVPAALVMELPPEPQFVEPDPALRARMIKYADAITAAANAIIKRLHDKEFKKPADVLAAWSQEIEKAGG